jgi:hypothetical protein
MSQSNMWTDVTSDKFVLGPQIQHFIKINPKGLNLLNNKEGNSFPVITSRFTKTSSISVSPTVYYFCASVSEEMY